MIGILRLSFVKDFSLFLSDGCFGLDEVISVDDIALGVRLDLFQILCAILETACVFTYTVISGCPVKQGFCGVI